MRRMNGGFDVVDDERNDKRDDDDYDEDGLENNGRDGGDRTDDDGDGDGPGGGGGRPDRTIRREDVNGVIFAFGNSFTVTPRIWR